MAELVPFCINDARIRQLRFLRPGSTAKALPRLICVNEGEQKSTNQKYAL